MNLLWSLLIFSFLQDDVPLKPNNEFEIKLDYQFKQRPPVETKVYNPNGALKTTSSTILPYLILNFKVIELHENEIRLRMESNLNANLYNRKVKVGDILPIDFGFTEDVKDKVTAHAYTIFFLSAKKEVVSKITIVIEEDGTFKVNGEKRGQV